MGDSSCMKSPRLFLAMRFHDSAAFFALDRKVQKQVEERLMEQFMPMFPKELRDRWAHTFEFPLSAGKSVLQPGDGDDDTMTTDNIYAFVEKELPHLAKTVPGLQLAPRGKEESLERRCHLANNLHAADCEFSLLHTTGKKPWTVREDDYGIEVDIVLKFTWGTNIE